MIIWVIGKNGSLGRELIEYLVQKQFTVVSTGRETSICDIDALNQFAFDKKPNYIMNCAAFTDLEKAEVDQTAFQVNAIGPKNIAEISKKLGAKFIHLSTDYVFSENESHNQINQIPFTENDATRALNAYGRSKAEAEKLVLEANNEALIIRTAWLYGKYGKNFVTTISQKLKLEGEISVVNDQFGNPTWIRDLCDAIWEILKQKFNPGIFHYTGKGFCTWYELACEIQHISQSKIDTKIIPISTEDFPSKVKRPKWSVLESKKINDIYKINQNDWKASLRQFIVNNAKIKTE